MLYLCNYWWSDSWRRHNLKDSHWWVDRDVWGVIVWPGGQVNSLAKRFVIVVIFIELGRAKRLGKSHKDGGQFSWGPELTPLDTIL